MTELPILHFALVGARLRRWINEALRAFTVHGV
jgi:hypothetical protein